jgi:hypothetical protein
MRRVQVCDPTPEPVQGVVMSSDGNMVDVVFRVPADIAADHVALCGDFNDWSTDTSMIRNVDGSFELTVALQPGESYCYRFLVDGTRWENDRDADSYAPNPYGGSDSVVDLTSRRPAGGTSEDISVRSIPLETEDGETVVIEQQNAGPGNQVGGGEYKNATGPKSVQQAADEQDALDDANPIEPTSKSTPEPASSS